MLFNKSNKHLYKALYNSLFERNLWSVIFLLASMMLFDSFNEVSLYSEKW